LIVPAGCEESGVPWTTPIAPADIGLGGTEKITRKDQISATNYLRDGYAAAEVASLAQDPILMTDPNVKF
jgi:hypothetical protein